MCEDSTREGTAAGAGQPLVRDGGGCGLKMRR
jgi:hypothetical protein